MLPVSSPHTGRRDKGTTRAAQGLAATCLASSTRSSSPSSRDARAPRDLEHLLSVRYTDARLSDLVLSRENHRALRRLITEQRAVDTLAQHGLHPRRRLLLHGPPGCGKTMAAHAIAGELRLPIIRIRLEVIFSRYLGETASTLAEIFAKASRVRGVYLFDEFDALGRTRVAIHQA